MTDLMERKAEQRWTLSELMEALRSLKGVVCLPEDADEALRSQLKSALPAQPRSDHAE